MKKTKILVIGSAHLDVLATFNPDGQKDKVDVIGDRVKFGVGGTALNIAAWLLDMGHKPYVFTAINKLSFPGQVVVQAMKAGGMSRKYIIDDASLPDSAFVAHIDTAMDRSLHFGVSCMAVGESHLLMNRLKSVVRKFDWIVFDCNLSKSVISQLSEHCSENVRLIGAATSDTKVERLIATKDKGTRALCMNHREALALLPHLDINHEENSNISISEDALVSLQKGLNCKTLMVTQDNKGWYLVSKEGVVNHSPPLGIDPVTTVGAGDAACAGLLNALIHGRDIAEEVNRVTRQALWAIHATRFAENTSPEALRKYAKKRRILKVIEWVPAIMGLLASFLWVIEWIKGIN